jgi:MFS family permease
MEDQPANAALVSALTTEHFVLQTAASSTIAEAAARSTLYVMALSSALVAMGFASQSSSVFLPFALVALPGIFILGIFTVVRLVDTTLENQQYLTGISRIRNFYKTLTPEAEKYLKRDTARWPEASVVPSLMRGRFFAMFGTTAVMIAFLNNLVAGATVTIATATIFGRERVSIAIGAGIATAVIFMVAFMSYQKKRFVGLQQAIEATENEPAAPR